MNAESHKNPGMPTRVGALLKYVIPVIISGGLCWLLFRDFDFRAMAALIARECDWRPLALMCVISILSHVLRAMRWQIQLRAIGVRVPLFYVVLSIFGTYAVNLVFPRLGELWRTGYIAGRSHSPFATVFGSMVADRLADTVTVGLLLLLTLCVSSGRVMAYLSQNGDPASQLLSVVLSPWLWLAALGCLPVLWWVLRARSGFAGKVRSFLRGLWDGFAVIAVMPGLGRWLLLTVGVWGCYYVQLYVAFYAFDFTASVASTYGPVAVLVTFVLSSISMAVPSNGGIGPWQWAVMFALAVYGVATPEAGAFANTVLGCNTLLVIALGLFAFGCIALSKNKHKNTNYIES